MSLLHTAVQDSETDIRVMESSHNESMCHRFMALAQHDADHLDTVRSSLVSEGITRTVRVGDGRDRTTL